MRTRVLRITEQFRRTQRRVAPAGTPAAQALAATLARLTFGELPAWPDSETLVPPVRRYWFRRVPNMNLWVLYSFDDAHVTARAVVSSPPVPVGGREG
ncbi:MAG: hypothetical protein JW940_29835 [Polyangiaceae bacterium]|nr:hypothetical protein [Polyangiaceae bacterium]